MLPWRLGKDECIGMGNLNSDRQNQTITLADNSVLGFAEYGPAEGIAVFHFHGSGGSRLSRPVNEGILFDLGIRYIATDRPGHGLSSYVPDRRLLDWAAVVATLADHLGIERFHVLGNSAGGAYALACAHQQSERIISGALVSGLAPPDRPKPYTGYRGALRFLLFLVRNFPAIAFPVRRVAARLSKALNVENAHWLIGVMPKIDHKVLSNAKAREWFINDLKESMLQGGKGVALDDIIVNSSWGFDIRDIQTRFDVWQGTKDANVPKHHGLYQADLLPNSRLHLMQDHGHMLLLDLWEQVLTELIK